LESLKIQLSIPVRKVEVTVDSEKISGFEREKRGCCMFLAFGPIFGGKNGDFWVTSSVPQYILS